MTGIKQKRIAVLLAGGTVLTDHPQRIYTVDTEEDIPFWFDHIKEVRLIADIEPIFITGDDRDMAEPSDWDKIYAVIEDRYHAFDGFVVVQHPRSFPYAPIGAALSFQGTKKPIVFTGSPLEKDFWNIPDAKREYLLPYHHLGLRTHLLSAVQVATLDIPEVLIVLGNQICRAAQTGLSRGMTTDPFTTNPDGLIGRLEFGLKLVPYHPASHAEFSMQHGFDARVVRHYVSPDFKHQAFPVPDNTDGVALYFRSLIDVPPIITDMIQMWRSQDIFVLLHRGHIPLGYIPDTVYTYNMSEEVAYMKFIWALSQTRSLSKIQHILDKDVAGEIQNRLTL